MFGCCESESIFNHACLIILSYTVIYYCDTYADVSSASVSNVGMSFITLKIKQHLCFWNMEILPQGLHKIPRDPFGKFRKCDQK